MRRKDCNGPFGVPGRLVYRRFLEALYRTEQTLNKYSLKETIIDSSVGLVMEFEILQRK